MHGGSGKAGMSQTSTEALARANQAESEGRPRRTPSRRETIIALSVIVVVLLAIAGWGLVT